MDEMQREMKDLEYKLAEAKEFNDLGGIESFQEQIEKLKRHFLDLTRRGQSKLLGNEAEKIRKAVTKCIKASLSRIEQENRDLWRHLDDSIKTGIVCTYKPKLPTKWMM
jgi:Skp family chaperone for outer membrane proteins